MENSQISIISENDASIRFSMGIPAFREFVQLNGITRMQGPNGETFYNITELDSAATRLGPFIQNELKFGRMK